MIYESNNQFFPSAYKINNITHNLVWEGRKLKQFGLETYKYDENGIRISKLAKDDEIKFYLEGNKIVASIRNFMYHTENMIVNTYFSYDSNDSIVGLHIKGKYYFYVKDILGIINKIIDKDGNELVIYTYNAWGVPNRTIGMNLNAQQQEEAEFLIYMNPFMYKGYYYDVETSLYYCNSKYYNPEWGRWLSADDVSYLDPSSVNGLNLYAYCLNNPVMYADPSGCLPTWAKWVIGGAIIVGAAALTVVTAGGFAAAGTAVLSVFIATMAPTAASAVFAGAFVGSLAIGTAGMIIAGLSGEDGWSWDKAADGFMWGSIAGAVIGGTWGGTHYALQNTGKMAIKTNINNLLNNPLDDFVTIGPKDGGISSYVRSISQTGEYGNIHASKLGNGIYQIANGHHRIAALRQLGYNSVKFFLVP